MTAYFMDQTTFNNFSTVVDLATIDNQLCAGKLTLAELAAQHRCSIATLNRRFKKQLGTTPMRWLWDRRAQRAAELMMAAPDLPCGAIARACGFVSLAHFSRRFQKQFQISPSLFRCRAWQYQQEQHDRDQVRQLQSSLAWHKLA